MKNLIIWDEDSSLPSGNETIILWRKFNTSGSSTRISIPSLIERDSENLRVRYLSWIYDLGKISVKGKPLATHFELSAGFNYWWTSLFVEKCSYSKSPQIVNAIRLMAFNDWVGDQILDGITLNTADEPLAKCLAFWCQKKGIKFNRQKLQKPLKKLSWIHRCYQSLPFVIQGLIWGVRHIHRLSPLRSIGLEGWKKSKGHISFISYLFNVDEEYLRKGIFKSAFWAHLPDQLLREGIKTNWLHLFVPNSALPNAQSAADAICLLNKNTDRMQTHTALEAFLNITVIFRTLNDLRKLVFIKSNLGADLSNILSNESEINLWPLFVDDWNKSFSGALAFSNLLNFHLLDSAIKSLPKKNLGIFLQENQGWEFCLIQAWRRADQGQLIGCPHSSVRFWDLRYYFDSRNYHNSEITRLPRPDKIAINGKAAMNAYIGGGYPSKDLISVEGLRYFGLLETQKKLECLQFQRNKSLRLLVLGDYLPKNTHIQLTLLEQAASKLPSDLLIIFKPHPACTVNPSVYSSLKIEVRKEPIYELLINCDVAYASAVTSAAVDAYCAGAPLICVLDPCVLNLSPLRGYPAVSFVATAEELISALFLAISKPFEPGDCLEFFDLDFDLPRWRKLMLNIS